MKRLFWFLALAATLLALPPLTAAASPDLHLDQHGVAIHGYEPVAYFTEGKPVKGSAKLNHRVGDALYYFANARHRDEFARDPGKYAPQFGGFCAMGAAMGKKLDVDPQAWRIVDGRLYLNLNKDVQNSWLSDVPGHIAQANAKWPEIKDVPAAQLK